MTRSQLGRTMVEHILRQSLHQVQQDPKRTVRNLVDLGLEASGGRLQQRFLATAQTMLAQQDSPYYDLVRNAVNQVDQDRLLTFGLNLGWNGLTQGACRLRELEEQRGHNIPWSLTFHLAARPAGLSAQDYLRLIQEGMELGIYVYFLMPEDFPSFHTALELAKKSQACAFFLCLPPGCDLAAELPALEGLPNLLLGLDTMEPGWQARANLLREGRYLYSLCRRYATPEDVEDIVSGRWMERVLPYGGLAAILISAGGASRQEPQRPVHGYTLDSRMAQRYPMLLLDLYPDTLYLDVLLSDGPCFAGFLPDGTLTEFRAGQEAPTRASARAAPLASLLQRFPRRGPNH